MKQTWFQVKVAYDKLQQNGSKNRQKEVYLVDALSFTEAEKRVTEELKPFIEGEFKVTAMKLENIQEIFNSDMEDGYWYKANVSFSSIDEKTAKEKKSTSVMLVYSDSTDNALKRLHEGMKGSLSDYEVKQLTKTAYVDLFFYELDQETEETR